MSVDNPDWVEIKDYPGYYVTNDGRVKSPRRQLKPGYSKDGYPQVALIKDGKHHTKKVHRLVIETFGPPQPEGYICLHGDGSRDNNSITNLRWGTYAENYADARKHGTNNKGTINGSSVLDDNDIRKIRSLRSDGLTQRAIAKMYKVSQVAIFKVLNEVTWGHVK